MNPSFKDHLRLDFRERQRLLQRLNRLTEQREDAGRRHHERFDYPALDIALSVIHPGGGESRLLVCSRNLSAGGIAFLHGGYLHPGSECRVALMQRDGAPTAVRGIVRHCRHLQGSCHEIGLQFEREIDPHVILMPSSLEEADEQMHLETSVQIPALKGRVLIVDDSASDRRLLAHQLTATGLQIQAVETSGAALDAVKRAPFDLVICGLDLTSGRGIYAVQQMRAVGFTWPIIVLTAEMSGQELAGVRQAGATEVVGKPFEPSYIIYLLGELLDQPALAGVIHSRFDGEPDFADLLERFIQEARFSVTRLRKAEADGELEMMREICRRLSGSGTSHGFDQVSEAAQDVLRNLAASDDLSGARHGVRRLEEICERLACSQRPESLGLPARQEPE